GAGHSGHERDDALAIETEFTHQLVHQKDHTRHITAFLEQGNEGKQDRDLRYEDDNASDTGNNSVSKETGEWAVGQNRAQIATDVCKEPIDPIHWHRRPGENRLKDYKQ